MNEPLVSIIIPTKNSLKTLARCLESIILQTYKPIEMVVVDANSTDGTKEIAEWYGAKLIQTETERAKAKNLGCSLAKGQYVMFVDSDMELTHNVVRDCVQACTDETSAVLVPERSVGKGFWVRVRDFERSFYADTEIESPRFFRRSAVLCVGGFDEDVIFFEESTIHNKMRIAGKLTLKRIGSAILHIEDGVTFVDWCRKKAIYAKTLKRYEKRYPEHITDLISPRKRIMIYFKGENKMRFLENPILAIGVLALKISEFIAIKSTKNLDVKL